MTKRRRGGPSRRAADARFWGVAPGQPAPTGGVVPTPDPAGLVRSLGPAPLVLDPGVVERHLQAVYEEAVRTATALAAANGLLHPDED